VTPATEFGPQCPQTRPSVGNPEFIPGNEDCLFLDVYAPPKTRSKLPVLVWIHGGGYNLGNSHEGGGDLRTIINANNKGFIGVSIQYRVSKKSMSTVVTSSDNQQLGAFGFLSSAEVKAKGVTNAAILDMEFALKWVQKNIEKFGGDPRKVTISGESAGGGAVMLMGIARGGKLGRSLFQNVSYKFPFDPIAVTKWL
jgi:carboxylesterase type B